MVRPAILKTATEIARYLGISRRSVFRYIKHRGLPATLTPGGMLITSTTLLAAWHDALRYYGPENRQL
jgi:excisionase family DNA binding protein